MAGNEVQLDHDGGRCPVMPGSASRHPLEPRYLAYAEKSDPRVPSRGNEGTVSESRASSIIKCRRAFLSLPLRFFVLDFHFFPRYYAISTEGSALFPANFPPKFQCLSKLREMRQSMVTVGRAHVD